MENKIFCTLRLFFRTPIFFFFFVYYVFFQKGRFRYRLILWRVFKALLSTYFFVEKLYKFYIIGNSKTSFLQYTHEFSYLLLNIFEIYITYETNNIFGFTVLQCASSSVLNTILILWYCYHMFVTCIRWTKLLLSVATCCENIKMYMYIYMYILNSITI